MSSCTFFLPPISLVFLNSLVSSANECHAVLHLSFDHTATLIACLSACLSVCLQAKQHLEAELQKRVRAIEHLSADNDHLRATLIASSDVKDTTIIRLQCQRETLRVNQDTQDVICQSLSDETVTLKERLRATAEVCQHLVRQLERKLPGGMPLSLDQVSTFLIPYCSYL